jgi:hypothetical protein
MTSELFLEWIKLVWAPHVKSHKRSLLLIDQFSGHTSEAAMKALSKLQTDVLLIPAGLTGKLQPLDVYINKPLKLYMSQAYESYLEIAKKTKNGNEYYTLSYSIN